MKRIVDVYSLRLVVLGMALLLAALPAAGAEASPEPAPEAAQPAPPSEPVPQPATDAQDTAADTEAQPPLPELPPKPAPERLVDLEEAKQIAVQSNPSLMAAAERVKQAQARVKQARSTWFPTVLAATSASNTWISENDFEAAKRAASSGYWASFASATQARLQGEILAFAEITGQRIAQFFNPQIGPVPTFPAVPNTDREIVQDLFRAAIFSTDARNAIDEQLERYTISVVAEWIVFNGFERRFANLEARYGKEQTDAAHAEAHRVLLDAVAQAYYAAQLARENIAIAEADEAFNQRLVSDARARRRVGTGPLSDVLNFEVRVNAARAALITARQNYETALIALAELLALPESKWPDTLGLAPLEEESLEELEAPDADALVAFARSHRPDLRVNELDVKRAEAIVGIARSPFYPDVRVQASKDAVRVNDFDFGEDDFSTTIGFDVTYEIFAGGRNVARLQEAKSLRQEAQHVVTQSELEVASDVRTAVEELRAAQNRLVLQRANAALVQRNRDLAQKAYDGGIEPAVTLNEAQRNLVEAQADLALARVQLRNNWHAVRTATGETIVPFLGEVEAAGATE